MIDKEQRKGLVSIVKSSKIMLQFARQADLEFIAISVEATLRPKEKRDTTS
jgi:hypothetical protein